MSEADQAYLLRQIAARERSAVIKLRYLSLRSKYPEGLLIAVEGKDDQIVYSYWLSREQPELRYEFIVCGGKRNVRKLVNSLCGDRGGASKKVWFFVDRDFDDLQGFDSDERVFLLPNYSIENYLVEAGVLRATLKCALCCIEYQRLEICAHYERVYAEYLHASSEVNWRIFLGRRIGCDIDDLIPKKLDQFSQIEFHQVKGADIDLEKLIPIDVPEDCDLNGLRDEFDEFDPGSRYRGKFAWKFFQKWINLLAGELRSAESKFTRSLGLGEVTLATAEFNIGPLAARAQIPVELGAFIGSQH